MIKSLNIFSKKYVRTVCSNDPIKYYMKKIKEKEKEINVYNDRED